MKYCNNCQCQECQNLKQDSFICLMCSDRIEYECCNCGCMELIADNKNKRRKSHKIVSSKVIISIYSYNQNINNKLYSIYGCNNSDYLDNDLPITEIYSCKSYNGQRKLILSLGFQPISNQQELEELAPRLLKMKAFV